MDADISKVVATAIDGRDVAAIAGVFADGRASGADCVEAVDRSVGRGVNLFRVAEVVFLRSLLPRDAADSLVRAGAIVAVHGCVLAVLAFPLWAAASLWGQSTVAYQAGCCAAEVFSNACRPGAPPALLWALWALQLALVTSFGTMALLEYICRYLDNVDLRRDAQGLPRSLHGRARQSCLSARGFLWTQRAFTLCVGAAFTVDVWLCTNAALYILLLATVAPARVVPAVLCAAAVVVNARLAFSAMERTRRQVTEKLRAPRATTERADDLQESMDAVMLSNGLDSLQLGVTIVVYSVAFACFVAFLITGVLLFVAPGQVLNTLLTSAIALASAVASMHRAVTAPAERFDDDLVAHEGLVTELSEALRATQAARAMAEAIDNAAAASVQPLENVRQASGDVENALQDARRVLGAK